MASRHSFRRCLRQRCAREFGTEAVKTDITKNWKSIYYPDGVPTANGRSVAAELKQQREDAREARREEAHRGPDTMDMLMFLPYINVLPNELQTQLREAQEKAQAAEQKRVEEIVVGWRRRLADT